ncbi:MAG: MerR family transcriptional regulator [Deltaproteobacteria bacterium]
MTKIPDKLYFKIGEVARITRVKPYVLRYWESEFKIISPKKSLSKQRVYTRKDVDLILEIKNLLYKEKFTLDGAKRKVREARPEPGSGKSGQLALPFTEEAYRKTIRDIKKELCTIREMLVQP